MTDKPSFVARLLSQSTAALDVPDPSKPPETEEEFALRETYDNFCDYSLYGLEKIRFPVPEPLWKKHVEGIEAVEKEQGTDEGLAAEKTPLLNNQQQLCMNYNDATSALNNLLLNTIDAGERDQYADRAKAVQRLERTLQLAVWTGQDTRAYEQALAAELYQPTAEHNMTLSAHAATIVAQQVVDVMQQAKNKALGVSVGR